MAKKRIAMMAKKRKTIMVGKVPHTMTELRESLKCANAEAQGYLDQLTPLREEHARLTWALTEAARARRLILEILGVPSTTPK